MSKDEVHIKTVYDENGNREAVIVPIEYWESIQKELGIEDVPYTKEQVMDDLRESFEAINLLNEGKIKGRDARELLNEL